MKNWQKNLDEAVRILRAGGLVAFPTETVYGLGADARSEKAVAALYRVKGRPRGHPVIVHALDFSVAAREWAAEVPEVARRLAARFTPGPLTLILPRNPNSPPMPAGGGDGIALRVPSHPVARALLAAFDGPLAAPSANRFGRISPTSAAHVAREFPAGEVFILDGGECPLGLESAVVDCRVPALLRPGCVAESEIAKAAGTPLRPAPQNARAPGMLPRHYAPQTPLRLAAPAGLREMAKGENIAAFSRRRPPGLDKKKWRRADPDPAVCGRSLYRHLRELDETGAELILAENPPDAPEWRAIRDRLTRAAEKQAPTARRPCCKIPRA